MIFEALPAALKGPDKIIYESLSQLGLDMKLRHSVNIDSLEYDEEEEEYRYGPTVEEPHEDDSEFGLRKRQQKGEIVYLANGLVPFAVDHRFSGDSTNTELARRWNPSHTVEPVLWLNRSTHEQPALIHGVVT